MAKRGRKPGNSKPAAATSPQSDFGNGDGLPMSDYRHHGATRKNNPPAKIAAEGTVPAIPKAQYAYNPHLPPVLRFDPTGKPDALPELLAKARRGPLSEEEARTLATALQVCEPWLEWTGKREKKWFEVDPVALHIHERVSTQAILKIAARQDAQRSLFADPQQEYHEAVQFYRHDVDWANRLILGDSLQVMSSLARREDLAGKVQMIYMDPPYGIKFASNFQPEVGKRDVKDRNEDLTREPEMVRAYRDTWHLGIHSYLSYLRDRLIVARDMLAETGSIFMQISDENLHRVRNLLDEVFGTQNHIVDIVVKKKGSQKGGSLEPINDYVVWYVRNREQARIRSLFVDKAGDSELPDRFDRAELLDGRIERLAGLASDVISERLGRGAIPIAADPLMSGGEFKTQLFGVLMDGQIFNPPRNNSWKLGETTMRRVVKAERVLIGDKGIRFKKFLTDFDRAALTNFWDDLSGASDKVYVVQTNSRIVERCVLLTTDPGDIVLDPTCGSGTTGYVAEQWGRRWITIDTSRVAISIARQRLLTAKYEMFELRPITAHDASRNSMGTWLRDPNDPKFELRTFNCRSVPHITLKSIAQNVALDPIFAKHEPILNRALADCNAVMMKVNEATRFKLCAKLAAKAVKEGLRAVTDADARRWLLPGTPAKSLRDAMENAFAAAKRKLTPGQKKDFEERIPTPAKVGPSSVPTNGIGWEHWQIPFDTDDDCPTALREAVTAYRRAWRSKMDEVNACIAASAEQEELVDKPELVSGVTRVSGPFTVEAVQPPEMTLSDNIDPLTGEGEPSAEPGEGMFDGAPQHLPDGFAPRTLRMVEPKNELEAQNISAYLEQMYRFLKADGVRFLNNKQMKWVRLEPLFESGRASGFHAEGHWVSVSNGGKEAASVQEDDGRNNVAVIFGPQYGSVTAKVVEEAISRANRAGYDDLVVAGFSFDGAATGIVSETNGVVPGRGGRELRVHFAHVRPDINPGMNGLLKESPQAGVGQLFTVFGLPRVRVEKSAESDAEEFVVTMEGVDIFNPVTNEITSTGADKVAAWFLDGDYDGRTFCITQAFFPDKSAWEKLAKALNGKDGPIDAERFEAFSGTTSLPFPAGKNRCVAVKVIDPRGNEVMTVLRN